jgi:hypothetical protein
MTALAGWENFYVIVGSAAGALIGLQFVVVRLVADSPALRVAEGVAAFATPAIVHFGVVPGTPSRITYLSRSVNNGRLSGIGKNHRNQRETYFYCWCTHTIKSKE